MTRSSAFRKGVAERQRRSDDDPTPAEQAAMQESFGNRLPPGESFRSHLNQSTPHPLPGSARTMTTRGPAITVPNDANTLAQAPPPAPPATDSPAWQAIINQSQEARQRSIWEQARLPQSEQFGSGNYANQGHGPSANVQYLRDYQAPLPPSGGGTGYEPHDDDDGGLFSHLTGAVSNVFGAVAGHHGAGSTESHQDMNIVTAAAQDVIPAAVQAEHDVGQFAVESVTPMVTQFGSALRHPLRTQQNVARAIDATGSAIAHPVKSAKTYGRVAPIIAQHYIDNPDEAAKIAAAMALTWGVGELASIGTSMAASGVFNTIKGGAAAGRAFEVGEEGTQAVRAASAAEDVVGSARTAEGVEDAVTAAREAATAPRVPLRYRAAQVAERGVDVHDALLSKGIGMKEDLRNYIHNIPRRIVGAEERDLRLSMSGRFKERLAGRVAGEGEEASTSAIRQNVSQRIAPPRREMPDVPAGSTEREINRSENLWRHQAREELGIGPHHPTDTLHQLESGVGFLRDPEGWLFDKLGFDEGGTPRASVDDEVAAPGGVRFAAGRHRPKSTAKRRMPALTQPEQQRVPGFRAPDTDEPMYQEKDMPFQPMVTPPEPSGPASSVDDWHNAEPEWAPRTTRGADELTPPPMGGAPTTGGGSGNNQTPQYAMGRGFQRRQSSKGFWEGRPEFTGAATNYDRLTIRPITVPRGGPSLLGDIAGAAVAGKVANVYRGFRSRREGNEGNFEQVGEPAKDPFGDDYDTPMSYEEGMAPSAEAKAKADREAAWKPAF